MVVLALGAVLVFRSRMGMNHRGCKHSDQERCTEYCYANSSHKAGEGICLESRSQRAANSPVFSWISGIVEGNFTVGTADARDNVDFCEGFSPPPSSNELDTWVRAERRGKSAASPTERRTRCSK